MTHSNAKKERLMKIEQIHHVAYRCRDAKETVEWYSKMLNMDFILAIAEGDIPSAMNPPPGCPFQTRCNWKSKVAGGLCEKEVPPVKDMGNGHQIKCHLSDSDLKEMEPVIKLAAAE